MQQMLARDQTSEIRNQGLKLSQLDILVDQIQGDLKDLEETNFSRA